MNLVKKLRNTWQTKEELLKIELDLANVTDYLTEADKDQLMKKTRSPKGKSVYRVQRAEEKNIIKAVAERGLRMMFNSKLNRIRYYNPKQTQMVVTVSRQFKEMFMKKAGCRNGSPVVRGLMERYVNGDFDNEM